MGKKKKDTRHFDIVRDINTGRLFLAEYSSEAAEWYEMGTGRAYSMCGVQLIGPVAGKLVDDAAEKANEWANRGLGNNGVNITRNEVENTLCEYFSRGFDAARNMVTAEIMEMMKRLTVGCTRDALIFGRGSVTKEDVRSGLEKICAGNGVPEAAKDSERTISADVQEAAKAYSASVSNGRHFRDLETGFMAGAEWRGKRVAAYIRECLAPEEEWAAKREADDTEANKNYRRGKIRGYKDILGDLESGGLDEYMSEKEKEE